MTRKATLKWVASFVLSVPVLVLGLSVLVYGVLLVRRIDQSKGKGGRTKLNAMEQAKNAAAAKVLVAC